jgi:hypothetical protein
MIDTMTDPMKKMKPFMLVTDVGLLTYWAVSALVLLGLDIVPEAYLFKDYHEPIMKAWNWSYFPLDVVLSACGLLSLRRYRLGDPSWRILATFSLSLTFCAGLMAVSFWTIRLDFDPVWWIPNLFFVMWPCFFLPRLANGWGS